MKNAQDIYIKPFSKTWWANVWYYYKWYIIGTAAAAAFVAFFLAECIFNTQPDFTITYIGGLEGMGQIQAYQLEDRFAAVTKDIDGDGQTKAKFNIIYLDSDTGSEEMAAMYNMADIEIAGGDSVVLLFSEKFLDRYSKYGFCDLSEYVNEFNIDESLLKRYEDGTVYAVEMSQNPMFTELESIETKGLYLIVRPLRPNDKSSWQKANYDNGIQMARYILSGGTVNP